MSTAPHIDIDPAAFWQDPYPVLARITGREAPESPSSRELGGALVGWGDDIFVSEKQIDVFSSHQPQGLMNKLMGHNIECARTAMRPGGTRVFPAISPKTAKSHWTADLQAPCQTASWTRSNGSFRRSRAGLCAAVLGGMPEDDHRANADAAFRT